MTYLSSKTGKQYIDASGGAAVSCLGHGHPDVLAAMHAQTDKLAYAHTSFFTTEVAEELGLGAEIVDADRTSRPQSPRRQEGDLRDPAGADDGVTNFLHRFSLPLSR